MDKQSLRDFIDEYVRTLEPGQQVHVPSIVGGLANRATNPAYANWQPPPVAYDKERDDPKRWQKAVTRMVEDALREDGRLTTVCPRPPRGFWRV